MKFTLQKKELVEKIGLAGKFVSDRLTSLNALKGIYFRSESGKLHIHATNLNMFYHSYFIADVNDDINIVVDPKKIIEFVQLLLPGDMNIEIQNDNITIAQGKTTGTFPAIMGEDFPLPPSLLEEEQTLDISFLLNKLPFILSTASSDESRPVLSGVNFVVKSDEFSVVSTDGFRLSILKKNGVGGLRSMIIPSSFLKELVPILRERKNVAFAFSEKEKIASFKADDTVLYTRLIDGEFPPFEKVIPTEKNTTVIVKREELLRSTKIISIFAREFSNIILYSFSTDGMVLTPKKGSSEQNTTSVDCEFEGEQQKIALNFRYILDFLNNAKSDQIIFEILRSDAPVVLKEKGDDSFLHIIMPVRIQD